jgi:hypothetical protein
MALIKGAAKSEPAQTAATPPKQAAGPPGADTAAAATPAAKAEERDSGRDDFVVLNITPDNYVVINDDFNLTIRVDGIAPQLPAELRRNYDRFNRMSKEDRLEHLLAGMLRYGPTMVVLMLPVFALLQKLAYLGRGGRYPGRPLRYAEHLVYSAHLHAFAALMVILLLVLPFGWVQAVISIWTVYYVLRARNLVYGGRRWAGVLRSFVVVLVYSVVAVLGVAGLVVAAAMMR